jgi:dienelactone hydrolase
MASITTLSSTLTLVPRIVMKAINTLRANLLSVTTVHGLLFPAPESPYTVQWTSSELVDARRPDPFNSSHPRRIMISRFTPIPKHHCAETCIVPYMNNFIASQEDAILQGFIGSSVVWPKNILSNLSLSLCCSDGRRTSHRRSPPPQSYPVLLLGTGLNTTRLFYSATAQHLASAGFEVIVMDHPYETDVVQFPSDGTVIYGGRVPRDPNATEQLNFALDVRAQDASFVLDTLLRIPPSESRKVAKVGFVGSSFGGPAAAVAMYADKRIAAGVNLDGYMFGRAALEEGAPGPFLIFGSTGHNSSSDDSWARFWNSTTGNDKRIQGGRKKWMKELSVVGSTHATYTDSSLIGDVSGLRDNPQLMELVFGGFPGLRAMEIMREYLSDFFRFALQGAGEGLLAGPSSKFPEVQFLRTLENGRDIPRRLTQKERRR